MADLQSILSDFVRRAGLPNVSLDVSDISGLVGGLALSGRNEVRAAVEAITQIFQIDTLERGGTLAFRQRGKASVATITEDHLLPRGSSESEGRNLYTVTRTPRQSLPQRVELGFYDRFSDYQGSTQAADRQVGSGSTITTIDSRLVLTSDQARARAEILLNAYWSELYTFSFSVSLDFALLEAGDVITLTVAGRTWTARLLKITVNGQRLDIDAVTTDAASYQASLKGSDPLPTQEILLSQPAALYALNLPITTGISENPAFFLSTGRQTNDNKWRYTQVYRSDGGDYGLIQVLSTPMTHGVTASLLTAGNPFYTDKGSTVDVTLTDGTLSSVTELEMLNGANAALIGNELIQFQTATLLSGTTWRLSTLLRGRNGTEDALTHSAAGEVFLLLGGGLERTEMIFGDINRQTSLKGVSNGQLEPDIAAQAFTPTAANLKPYSPVHLASTRSAGTITFTWKRRTRYGGAWVDSQEVPLAEFTELYEMDIFNGANVVRTLSSVTPSVVYTSAQQVADFGSNQSSVSVRLYQMSSVVGRGKPCIATL